MTRSSGESRVAGGVSSLKADLQEAKPVNATLTACTQLTSPGEPSNGSYSSFSLFLLLFLFLQVVFLSFLLFVHPLISPSFTRSSWTRRQLMLTKMGAGLLRCSTASQPEPIVQWKWRWALPRIGVVERSSTECPVWATTEDPGGEMFPDEWAESA
jgi:hypothetical protein